MPLATHNVVGAFLGQDQADRAVKRLVDEGIPRSIIHVDGREEELLVAKAEMREEGEGAAPGLPLSGATRHQSRNALLWAVLGAIAGAVVGIVIGLLLGGGVALWVSIVALVAAGSTAGFVAGGLSGPRTVEAAHDTAQEARVDVSVRSEDQEEVERAQRILEEVGADRVERFDAEGNPLPELKGRSGYEAAPSDTGRRLERPAGEEQQQGAGEEQQEGKDEEEAS